MSHNTMYLKMAPEITALIKEIKDRRIQGWLAPMEGAFLYMVAQRCTGKGVIVEIGSWKGLSTTFIAKGSKAGKNIKVYSIDPHTGSSEHRAINKNIDTFEEFNRNIHDFELDDIVVPIRATSAEAANGWNKLVELIFIDGAHEEKLVRRDFEMWYPHIVDGGMIAMHDTTGRPGPTKVAKEQIIESGKFYDLKLSGSITFARKKPHHLSNVIMP